MRLRLKSAIKKLTVGGLALKMGCSQPYISALKKRHPLAWVYFENGEPVRIEYTLKGVLHKRN